MTRLPPLSLASTICLFMLSGCGDPQDGEGQSDAGPPAHHCAPGLKPMGPACVPIFDECQDDEVPMLGGGCKRVGPPTKCLAGWENGVGGWCEPILPKTKCPAGTMEKIGHATCQPIGDCGSGTWGKITAANIYVDQNHTGTGGKGTKTEPYKTIAEATDAATAGDPCAIG